MSPVIEFAKALISCPSITPHDAGCQAMIIEKLSAAGFMCEKMRFGEVDNLWARYGTQKPLFVFAGHTDVVPTGPEDDWLSNPFLPEIRSGYLYGRGASDMKGALAAMVIAAEQFVKNHPDFQGSLAFLLTSDEEGPSLDGTRRVMEVLKQRNEKIDYCIVGEPSSDTNLGDQIRVGRRGSLHGKLSVQGKQGHVAHPHLALNPIHQSMLALHELAHITWDKGSEHFPPTTFQISNIHSGTGATNVIPGHLECLFNFRFSAAVTPEMLQEKTDAILKKHDLKYHLEWTLSATPFLTTHGKLIIATQETIQSITEQKTRLSTGGGTSDGRFIAPTGAELLELGPSHATAHQVNECVRVEDLENLVIIYVRILERLMT